MQKPMFPVRPRPFPDESLMSYLCRLADANFYTDRNDFFGACRDRLTLYSGPDNLGYPKNPATFDALSSLTGQTPAGLANATLHRYAPMVEAYASLETIQPAVGPEYTMISNWHEMKSRTFRREDRTAFCPECLKESRYHRLYWDLVVVSGCVKHACLLSDRCGGCGGYLSIPEIVDGCCKDCGYDLTQTPTITIGQDEIGAKVQRYIQEWFGVDVGPEPPFHLLVLDKPAPILFTIFEGMIRSVVTKMPADTLHPAPCVKSNAVSPDIIQFYTASVTAFDALLHWPHGFFAFLDSFLQYRTDDDAVKSNVTTALGAFYRGWIEGYWNRPEYEFIQNEFNAYLVTISPALDYPFLGRTHFEKHPELTINFPYIAIEEVAQIFETTEDNVKRMVAARLVRRYQRQGKPNKMWVYQDDVWAYLPIWRECWTISKVASVFDLDFQSIQTLIEANVLRLQFRTLYDEKLLGWDGYVTGESVGQMVAGLFRKAAIRSISKLPKSEFFPFLDIAVTVSSIGITKGDLILRMLSGKLPCFCLMQEGKDFSGLYLSLSDLDALAAETVKENGWLDTNELAARLNSQPDVVSGWLLKGLIKDAGEYLGVPYFHPDLPEQLFKEFMSLDKVSEYHKIPVEVILEAVKKKKINPVAGPSIDGFHEYLFRRQIVYRINPYRHMKGHAKRESIGLFMLYGDYGLPMGVEELI